jgi:hypothetical protein
VDDTTPSAPEPMPPAPDDAAQPTDRRSGWDFGLLVITVALLGGLGVQSLIGTLYSWWATRAVEGWSGSPAFASYIAAMNAVAAPMVIALAVVMGLCVPKRLFSRAVLAAASCAMVAIGLVVWAYTRSMADGLAVYLLGAAGIQIAVVVMTVAGARSLRYLTEGRLTKAGSGLLHLGFIAFGYVVVALQRSEWMLPVFWVAFVLTIGGSALSFYAGESSRRGL